MAEVNSISNADVRIANRNRVYRFLYAAESPLSKQEIAYALSMSLPTLTQNLTELAMEGLIDNSVLGDSTSGRRPRLLRCVPEARWAVGAELTQGHIRLVAVNLRGEKLSFRQERCTFFWGESYCVRFQQTLAAFLREVGLPQEHLLGIGVTVPGTVEADRPFVREAPTIGVRELDFSALFEGIEVPVRLFNDANAGGYAEHWSAPAEKALAYLSVGRGVGGAIVLRGENFAGNTGRSGEFGHMILHPGGKRCGCGRRGCLEAYTSTALLSEDLGCSLERFFERLEERDALCKSLWNTYLDDLALGIHNLHMLLDAEIVLGGKLSAFMEPRLPQLNVRLRALEPNGAMLPEVRICRYRDEANAIGAALPFVSACIAAI